MKKTISAIILMAGSSTRFVDDNNKLSYQIINRPVFTYSLETFYNNEKIEHLYLVVSSTTINEVEEYVKGNLDSSKITIVMGGLTRAQSVRNAVKEVKEDFVLIHDAARPLVNKVDIDNLINQMDTNLLGTLYHPIYDTVKDTSNNKVVTLDRQNLKATTTPQFFSKKLYEKIINPNISDDKITDEISIFEKDYLVAFVLLTSNNRKVTTKSDIDEITYYLNKDENYLIGHSFDFHPFEENRKLILGGVEIPYPKGLAGHSDADVVYHVVAESIMGALGIGDLGTLFPDTDNKYLNMNSAYFIKEVMKHLKQSFYRVENIDVIIYLEKPNLKNYKIQMAKNIKELINCNYVNVKATTLEKKGLIGNGFGIASEAVVLLKKLKY